MKNIFKLSVLSLSLLLITACGGSGGHVTSTSSELEVSPKSAKLNAAKTQLTMDVIITNNYASNVKVELKDLSIDVAPCIVKNSTLTPNKFIFGDENNLKVTADLTFSKECTPISYQLKGKKVLTLDGKNREIALEISAHDFNESFLISEEVSTTPTGEEEEVIKPTIVIPDLLKEIKLKENSQSVEMAIKVFNNAAPYTKGSVKVKLPEKVLRGIDVGLFNSYEATVNEQGLAIFKYTGPSNLKVLEKNGDLSSIFKFYHVQNSQEQKEVKVIYSLTEDVYVPVDYTLNIENEDDDFSIGIPNVQKKFLIKMKDASGKNIDFQTITIEKVEVLTQNSLLAQVLTPRTGEAKNSVILDNNNFSSFRLVSKKLSGIAPIKVVIDFIDMNKEKKKLSTVVNVRVMSGLPSAISVSYVSTERDANRAKYIEKFAISVTDEYGNKVNTKPYISLGAIVGYAVDGKESSSLEVNSTKRLFYGRDDISSGQANGKIIKGATIDSTKFEEKNSASKVFQWVNSEGANTDKLVVFGAGKNYEAMGKWDFSKIDDRTLAIQDDYFGTDREGLYYAVGHNYYQDQCRDDGREWLGSTDSESYQLDDEGTVIVSYKYDYHLTGKDALVWVNLNGYQADTEKDTRIGEVTKHTLRGMGFKAIPTAGYIVPKRTEGLDLKFEIHHADVPEWYRNAKFSSPDFKTTCILNNTSSSNEYDARTCYSGGTGITYVTYNVDAPLDEYGRPASCSFNIINTGNIHVRGEF
jgi:hypothetical protein